MFCKMVCHAAIVTGESNFSLALIFLVFDCSVCRYIVLHAVYQATLLHVITVQTCHGKLHVHVCQWEG